MARGVDRLAASIAAFAWPAAHAAAGPSPLHDVLLPGGPQATHILHMWNVALVVCTIVFAAVLVVLAVALARGARVPAGAMPGDIAPDAGAASGAEPRPRRGVVAATIASAVLLVFLIVASVLTDRALAGLSTRGALQIQVTSNQWWWEVRYDGPPSETFMTANEIHVPVGRTVLVRLQSNDVIHSLWIPSLAGKKDLIPGRDAELVFRADKAGVYRGQCAEFCGVEHAWMAFEVVAEEPARYEQWAARQRRSAPAPATPLQSQGQQVFVSSTCAMCHAIGGTPAGAIHGPDLTHLASRRTLGAGTLDNTPANLARWIRDPHPFKPGVNMPASNLSDADLGALVAYLETLS